jgi:hypothetical protein
MIPLRKIRLRAFVRDINNQLACKCIKNPYHTILGLDVAGRLVDNAFYVKLTEDLSPNQSKTDIYVFSVIFHPPLLKSSQKFTFDGQMVIFLL